MKKGFYLGAVFAANFIFGQMGINNSDPKATLDVTAKTTDGTKPEGIIAPRLTGEEIKGKDAKYLAEQKGTIIYATSASSDAGMAGKKTINIAAEGYYYFDGLIWQKFNSGTAAAAGTEPWYDVATNTGATANTQNIYQRGSVGIGDTTPAGALSVGSDDGSFSGQVIINPQSTADEGGELILAASPTSTRRWVLDQHKGAGGEVLRLWSQHKTTFNADGTDFVFRDMGTTTHPQLGINVANPADMLHLRAHMPTSGTPTVGGILIDNTVTSSYTKMQQGYINLNRYEPTLASQVGGYIDFSGTDGPNNRGTVFRIAKTHVGGVFRALTMNIEDSNTPIYNLPFYLHYDGLISIGGDTRRPDFALTVNGGGIAAIGFGVRNGGVTGGWTGNKFNIGWNGTQSGLNIDNTFLGYFTLTSDYRLKRNVNTITTNAIDRVMQLRPVTYEYKDIANDIFKADNKVHEGFIAHELQAVIPAAVNGDKDALTSEGKIQPQTLNAIPVISVLTKAIQEQQTQIAELKQRIEQLERR
ncbi:tail fiber domain-containing protein [Chryseobacterium elymi]|nr:tail fiber domain-containing protein [Chryseobacterium elymi]